MLKEFLKYFIYGSLLFILMLISLILYMTWMPNPELTKVTDNENLISLRVNLKNHVKNLSRYSTGRNYIHNDNLTPSRNYIAQQFEKAGLTVEFHKYKLYGDVFSNVIVNIKGHVDSDSILVVGAHYDSIENSPGANDNASGVAALIELGKYLSKIPIKNSVRLVAFVNEEPPYFQTEEMGSLVYANSLAKKNENIIGMISIESIGYYTDQANSQIYPKLLNLFYPDKGNFISFIGNLESRSLVTRSISIFRKNSEVPSQGLVSPAFVPGVGWSDHWSFWVSGYSAIMVTDTAPNRYEHYHTAEDTAEKLNYEVYPKVVHGLFKVVEKIANDGV